LSPCCNFEKAKGRASGRENFGAAIKKAGKFFTLFYASPSYYNQNVMGNLN